MPKLSLLRIHSDAHATRGILKLGSNILCHTLELPWRSNDQNVSCIPEGSYPVIQTTSPRFGDVFYLRNVPARSGILIHAGNSVADTRGCVLVGLDCSDKKLLHSRLAMDKLFSNLPQTFDMEIIKICNSSLKTGL